MFGFELKFNPEWYTHFAGPLLGYFESMSYDMFDWMMGRTYVIVVAFWWGFMAGPKKRVVKRRDIREQFFPRGWPKEEEEEDE